MVEILIMNWRIIIDVAKEYVFFCKVGSKEYIEGEAEKMYIRLNIFCLQN